MSETLYRLWCEWDIGQSTVIFKTKKAALDYAEEAIQPFENFDEAYEAGLVGTKEVTVHE